MKLGARKFPIIYFINTIFGNGSYKVDFWGIIV
jgi:hypothetical protein